MPASLPVSLIVAATRNQVIGRDNQMPWHLPADLRYFKQRTLGKPIIMGRKTWESLGRPLPGRLNIVITRQVDAELEGAEVFADLEAALQRGQAWAAQQGVDEVMVIGGGQLYQQALALAQRVYLTRIDLELEGDTFSLSWMHNSGNKSMRKHIRLKHKSRAIPLKCGSARRVLLSFYLANGLITCRI